MCYFYPSVLSRKVQQTFIHSWYNHVSLGFCYSFLKIHHMGFNCQWYIFCQSFHEELLKTQILHQMVSLPDICYILNFTPTWRFVHSSQTDHISSSPYYHSACGHCHHHLATSPPCWQDTHVLYSIFFVPLNALIYYIISKARVCCWSCFYHVKYWYNTPITYIVQDIPWEDRLPTVLLLNMLHKHLCRICCYSVQYFKSLHLNYCISWKSDKKGNRFSGNKTGVVGDCHLLWPE